MPRQSSGPYRKRRIKKIRKKAKGYRSGRKHHRAAKEAVRRAGRYAYFSRRVKKRDYRSMWIVRIKAACNERGIAYNRFINGLRKSKIELNRKALSELALSEPKAFDELVDTARKALA